ncbi:Uncharacterised protein [Vibrio cholerae]|nr:Uncharacterised protein [Vibrio cholerae]
MSQFVSICLGYEFVGCCGQDKRATSHFVRQT